LALITAQVEGVVSHDRLKQISTDHPADLTKMLGTLVREGLLVPEGAGRGMTYRLPWQPRESSAVFDVGNVGKPPELGGLTPELGGLTPELGGLTPELGGLTPELGGLTPELGGLTPELMPQVISDLGQLSDAEQDELRQLAEAVNAIKRNPPEAVRQTVLALCTGRYLGLRVLAELLNRRDRDGKDLRTRILNPLVELGALQRAYPRPNDPRQAYIANPNFKK
jgi:ATP-dependent DNA helicase RecG